jgi:6-phosphogluconolactonase
VRLNSVWTFLASCITLMLSLILGACGGNSSVTTPPPPPPAEFLYATSNAAVLVFSVDPSTGALTPAPNGPSVPGGFGIAANPSASFLYSSDNAAGGVAGFSINQSGALSAVNGSPFLLPNDPPYSSLSFVDSLAMHPSGNFLYAPDAQSNTVVGFAIDGTTGGLTALPGSTFPAGTSPQQVVIIPSGGFLYASDLSSPGGIWGFSVNSSTGVLTTIAGSPFPTVSGEYADGLVAHPSGKFLFSVIPNGNCVEAFSVDETTGALTAVMGSPFTLGVQTFSVAYSIAQDPAGKFLYALGSMDERIYEFTIDANSGILTPVADSPVLDDQFLGLSSVVVDPAGKFLYFSGQDTGLIEVRSIDGSTGALTLTLDSPASAEPLPRGMTMVSVPQQ